MLRSRVPCRAKGGVCVLGVVLMCGVVVAQSQDEIDSKSAGGYFARMWRTSAGEKTAQPRCPSVERNRKGDLLLTFTHQAEGRGTPVLGLARSEDGGKSWSDPRVIYAPDDGDPRAPGTLTRLASGELLAPVSDRPGLVRILRSADEGAAWAASERIDCSPLREAAPYSRVVERGGELLMPVFGKLAAGDKEVPCSGLLRSTDSGRTWGGFTVIACGRDDGTPAYGESTVHAEPDGRMLALIGDAQGFVHRSVSVDSGRTWSPPEQRLLSFHPMLARVGTTLACADRHRHVSGVVRVRFSDNLFDSWRCDRMPDQDIKGDYFSAVALDEDRLVVVHDRGDFKPEGRGTRAIGGIEVMMMQRNPQAPRAPEALVPTEKRDQWELGERFSTSPGGFGSVTQGPGGKLYSILAGRIRVSADRGRSFEEIAKGPPPEPGPHSAQSLAVLPGGRWIVFNTQWIFENGVHDWNGTSACHTGPDGYLYCTLTGVRGKDLMRVNTSDDQGKSWQGGALVDFGPFVWMCRGSSRIIEESDGTLVMPVYGCLSREDTSGRVDAAAVMRSTDRGATWGDFTVVAYDRKRREIGYNEMDIQPMPGGTWAAVIRSEWRSHHGGEASPSSVSFSSDRGRTWTKPEYAFIGAVPELVLLPDGTLACATSFSKVRFSYDGGHTWSREIPSYTTHYPQIKLLSKDRLLLHDGGKDRRGIIYTRTPAQAQ